MGFKERYLEEADVESTQSTINGPSDAMNFIQNEVQKLDIPDQNNTQVGLSQFPSAQSQKELQPKGLIDNLQTIKSEQEAPEGNPPTDNDIIKKQDAIDNFRRRLGH